MTLSEENYLKTIYHLTTTVNSEVSTNAIAEKMETKASSVTDMLKKLAEKELVSYQKYQGVTLTKKGLHTAKMIVRKSKFITITSPNQANSQGKLIYFPEEEI